MNIAIIRRKFNPFGGAEQFILRTIQGLKSKNIKMSIIAESWEQEGKKSVLNNCEFIQASDSGHSRTKKFNSFSNSVHQILKSKAFDLVQSHERISGVDIYRLGDGIHASWVKRYSAECSWLKKIWLKFDPYHKVVILTEKAMASDQQLTFVANSTLVQKEIKDWYKVPDHRVVLIENGIDTQQFQHVSKSQKKQNKANLDLSPDLPVIVFVGSGFARKGAWELVDAVNNLNDYQLLVIGHDKNLGGLQKHVNQLQANQRIKVLGPQHDVKKYLASADIFCLPSSYDSFPNAALEALCCGLPIIITDAVGLADAVRAKSAGVICNKEAKSITLAIEHCWENLNAYSENALKLSKKYDISIANEKWLNLYNQLLEAKRVKAIANPSH
jgi:UDP-glucose:(heptosyl)LPS alpha-1,3-glucosyltransferase